MRRRRPLPNPRSAPPAPSGTTSAAPARTPGTRPPGNPPSSAPGRTATGARSRGAATPGPRTFCSGISLLSARLEPLGQPAAQDRLDRAVDAGNPRAVDPPPAAAVARRIAARHADRQTQRREHRPHPLPRPARRPPPDRVQLVHQRHQVPKPFNRGVRRPCLRPRRRAAPGTPPPRTAPAAAAAVVAARNPPPASTSSANSPRPRPLTRQRRSDTILPSGQSRFRPRSHLPFGPPERSQPGEAPDRDRDVRLPLPAVCPDCGADVLASADIKGGAQPRLPFDPLRIRRTER